jgi:hypothetical protein
LDGGLALKRKWLFSRLIIFNRAKQMHAYSIAAIGKDNIEHFQRALVCGT